MHGQTNDGSHALSRWRHQMETFSAWLFFVRGIHRLPVNSPHKGQWRGALMFSLICTLINDWVNNRKSGYLRRHRAHYDVTVMINTKKHWCIVRPYFSFCKNVSPLLSPQFTLSVAVVWYESIAVMSYEHHGILIHWPLDVFLLFAQGDTQKNIKSHRYCEEFTPVTIWIPSEYTSNTDGVSMSWCRAVTSAQCH